MFTLFDSCGGPAPKKRTANSTSSGYGRVSTGSAGSMSAPGLRGGKLEVRKEKSEKSERTPGDQRQKFEKKQNKSSYYLSYFSTGFQVSSFSLKKPMMIHFPPGFSNGLPRKIAWQCARSARSEKRLGCSSASSGGLGIKGPSPRMTPRSASASAARRAHGGNGAAMAVGLPPSRPLLRQEA